MAARSGGYRTPIPNRDVEMRTTGNGPVISYYLSPEELEKYRAAPSTPPRDSLGEKINAPVAHKEEKYVSTQAANAERFVPSKVEFLKGIAAGKSISKMERDWKMAQGSLHYYIGKWNLKGIKPERAEQLLDEIDAEEARKPVKGLIAYNDQSSAPMPAEPDIQPTGEGAKAASTQPDELQSRLDRALERIKSMTETLEAANLENSKLKHERDDYKRAATDLEEKLDKQSDHEAEIERLRTELAKTIGERAELQGKIEEYATAIDVAKLTIQDIESDRQVLLENMRQAKVASDPVNHPAHYTSGGIETIEFIRAKLTPEEFVGYCKGNVLKYVSRANLKGGVEDLSKATVYLGWAVGLEAGAK